MSSYALDNGWQEARRRLLALEKRVEPITRRRIGQLGRLTGLRCLEVGAGLGATARWLSACVGSRGKVVATDIDTRFLRELDAPNLEVWEHDVTQHALPNDASDLTHVRWLLYHLPDPQAIVDRLMAALRPGGHILLEDVDFFPLAQARSRELARLMYALSAAVGAKAGHGGEWAAQALPALLRASHADALRVFADLDVLHAGSSMVEFWTLTVRQMQSALLGSGALEPECLRSALAQFEQEDFWSYATAHVGVSGRRSGG